MAVRLVGVDSTDPALPSAVVEASPLARVVNVRQYGATGDGTTDDTTAVSAALAAGDIVTVPSDGTFVVGDVVVGAGKTLTGGGTLKKLASAAHTVLLSGASPAVIGLTFSGSDATTQPRSDVKLADGASSVTIQGCQFTSAFYSAIAAAVDSDVSGTPYTNPVSGVTIIGNRFTGGYARPIFLHSVESFTIANNLIRDCLFDAIRVRENDNFGAIIGNQFINIGDPAWPDTTNTRDAIDTHWSGQRLIIANNVIDTTAYHGIDLKGASETNDHRSERVIITGNIITGCRYLGIVLTGWDDYDGAGNFALLSGVSITNNIIEGCGLETLAAGTSPTEGAIDLKQLVRHVTVSGNQVIANHLRGIHVRNNAAGKAANEHIKILNNTVVNNGVVGQAGYGIIVQGASWVDIRGNTVLNDTEMPNSGAQTNGIQVTRTHNGYTATDQSVAVDDNTAKGHATNDIVFLPANELANVVRTFRGNSVDTVYRSAWMHKRRVFHGSGVPSATDGQFNQGDIIFAVAPAASGFIGWVCVTTGSPGTWKTFGAISA